MNGPARPSVLCAVFMVSVGSTSVPRSAECQPFEVPLIAPGKQVSDLVRDLSSDDAATRAGAAWALAAVDAEHADLVAALEPLRSDAVRTVRYAAAWAIGHLIGPTPDRGLPPGHAPPRVKHQARPRYPQDAFARKIQGTVLLEVLIGEAGEVAYARVRESVPQLDAAALDSVRRWQFEPMRIGDAVRATVIHLPLTFRIY